MAEEMKSNVHSPAQKKQPPSWEEVNGMTEKEQAAMLIDSYINLQRIKSAPGKEKEVEYQIKTVRAKLETLGVMTENLDIH